MTDTKTQTTPPTLDELDDILWRAEIWLKQFYAGKPLDMVQSEKVYKLLQDMEKLK